jgi:pilus assembly protein Flp/PilA
MDMAFDQSRTAQGLVEYALIIMLVAMIVIVMLFIVGAPIANVFSNVIANI